MPDKIYNIDPTPGHVPFEGIPRLKVCGRDWVNDPLKPYRWYHALRDRFLCWWYGV